MGLDITAYRRLEVVGLALRDDNEENETFYANPDFPGREAPLDVRMSYKVAPEDEFGFRAGSYSGYSRWRAQLAELAGYAADWGAAWDVPPEGPFVELVNFSDCEGTLGATVCAKLAADFAAFQEKADTHADEYWRERYAAWRKACEMAADGGAIAFH